MSAAVLDLSAKLAASLRERPVPEIGVHPDATMAEYHSWAGASNSRLSKLKRSPAHLQAHLNEPDQDTDALRVGRAVHSAILEPDSFQSVYQVASQCEATKKGDGNRCTNTGVIRDAKQGWLCGVHGRTAIGDSTLAVLTAQDYALCLKLRDAVHRHPSASRLISGEGQNELSLVWQDAESGVRCKARHDRHSPRIAGGAVVDIKTTADASPRAFEKSIYNFSYYRQAAFYLNGAAELHLPAMHFVIIAVEKEPPYGVAVYRVSEGAIDAGQEEIRRLLSLWAECDRDPSRWSQCYAEDVQDAALPDYAWNQLENA